MSVMKYIVQFLLFLWIGSVPFVGKAQEKDSYTVSGTVMTETGSPLPGVTVIIKNEAGVGTATNSDGVFSLKDVGKSSGNRGYAQNEDCVKGVQGKSGGSGDCGAWFTTEDQRGGRRYDY